MYFHNDKTLQKAENNIRFVPLCGDGVFWAAKLEVLVNRAHRVKVPRKTDQWVQRAHGVRLAALWLCGRTMENMREGDEVATHWVPELEANPMHPRWKAQIKAQITATATSRLTRRSITATGDEESNKAQITATGDEESSEEEKAATGHTATGQHKTTNADVH